MSKLNLNHSIRSHAMAKPEMPPMENRMEKYEQNPEFLEFLIREFDATATNATIEEQAEFAFGSVEAAIKAFEEQRKNEDSNRNQPGNEHIS